MESKEEKKFEKVDGSWLKGINGPFQSMVREGTLGSGEEMVYMMGVADAVQLFSQQVDLFETDPCLKDFVTEFKNEVSVKMKESIVEMAKLMIDELKQFRVKEKETNVNAPSV